MTKAEQSAIDQIEEDRQRREREMLLLFLILFGTATRHAAMAIRLGHDPIAASRNVIMGNPRLGLPGLPAPMARLMAAAHSDGLRRAELLAGSQPSAAESTSIDRYYGPAQRMASRMADTLGGKIDEAVRGDTDSNARGVAGEVQDVIARDGYGKENPYLLETVSERIVIDAHGAGMWDGWQRPELNDRLRGFVHHSQIDDATTAICRHRDGYARPKDDPYWRWNWPALHWGCRSIILPAWKDREWSLVAPTIPAAEGFGQAPWAYIPFGIAG